MEWLVLTAVAAGVAIAIALLWGFSGCDAVFQLHRKAIRPENLTATALSTSQIQVSWTPESSYEWFEVERWPDGGARVPLPRTHTSPITDTGLTHNTTYFYRARTIGNDERSGWTDDVSAMTLPLPPLDLQPAFETTLSFSGGANPNRCLVQRIEAVRLLRSGAFVQLTISGSTNADLVIDRIYISRAAALGKPYDADGDLTHVATDIRVPAADPPALMALPVVEYALDGDQPLLIAFDINAGNQGLFRWAGPLPDTDAASFTGEGHQAAEAIRTPGYVMQPRIFLVQKIEVA